jgi:hypothetical protein
MPLILESADDDQLATDAGDTSPCPEKGKNT